MKTVNFQLDGMNSLEITQIEENLFEVRVALNGKISMNYMNREQLKQIGSTYYIENSQICIDDLLKN
ncbi:hypothetical protein [Lysinibacillus sp. FSL L8-0126]|uniref:hypothetical protein n=1 Tax=Lysinibacillus sp. FSL L8-0126 TaxID=2921515 RepID=UPI00315A193F